MKKIKFSRLPAVLLLLLSVTVLLFASAIDAIADSMKSVQLIVNFEPTQCEVKLSYDGSDSIYLEDGEAVTVPFLSENVRVTVVPVAGYALEKIERKHPDGSVTVLSPDGNSYYIALMNADHELDVTCTNRTFRVQFEKEEGVEGKDYHFLSDEPEKYESLTYTYGTEVRIAPAEKNTVISGGESGYDFYDWEAINGKGERLFSLVKVKDNETGDSIIPSELSLHDDWLATGVILLRPRFTPKSYPVICYDALIEPNPATPAQTSIQVFNYENPNHWNAEFGTKISGAWGENEVSPYPGYCFAVTGTEEGGDLRRYYTETVVNIATEELPNVVYRYFMPIVYDLEFDWQGGEIASGSQPDTHQYNQTTALPTGTRTGYTFAGWEVVVNGETVEEITDLSNLFLSASNKDYTSGNDGETQRTITLRAIWNANEYSVTYDPAGGTLAEGTPDCYQFSSDLPIPNPTRSGYTFTGWVLFAGTNREIDFPVDVANGGQLTLAAGTYTEDISLTAQWKANRYVVTLDGNGATTVGSDTWNVTYDSRPSADGLILPGRLQYTFKGFFTEPDGGVCYLDENGAFLPEKWNIASDTTLYAHWELLPVLPVDPTGLRVDYTRECFVFPNGSYSVTCGDQTLRFDLSDSSSHYVSIPDAFFGNLVHVTVLADGVNHSDFRFDIRLAARPAKPNLGEGEAIRGIAQDYTTLTVKLNESYLGGAVLEYALAVKGQPEGTYLRMWQDSPLFADLHQGTVYTVHIRVKAIADAPCGISAVITSNTYYENYVLEMIEEIRALQNTGDGEMVKNLIEVAVADVMALQEAGPSQTFYEDIESIYRDTIARLPFARLQDTSVANLCALRDSLIGSSAFAEEGQATLCTICDETTEQIVTALTEAQVNRLYNDAVARMTALPMTRLIVSEGSLLTSDGMPQGSVFTLEQRAEFIESEENVQSVLNAVRMGRVRLDGLAVDFSAVRTELREKKLLAYYSMSLMANGSVVTEGKTGLVYLRLPASLAETSGLRAAHFNAETGVLEVLDTWVEGEYLVFRTNQFTDVVILGDVTVSLTGMILFLSAVVLFQLFAILLLLRRRKMSAEKSGETYAVIPAGWMSAGMLAIRVTPAYGNLFLWILGGLAVVLQIVLLVLICNTCVTNRHKKSRQLPESGDSNPQEIGNWQETQDIPGEAYAEGASFHEEDAQVGAFPLYRETNVDDETGDFSDWESAGEEDSSGQYPFDTFDPTVSGTDDENPIEDGQTAESDYEMTDDCLAEQENGDGEFDAVDVAPFAGYSLSDEEFATFQAAPEESDEPEEPLGYWEDETVSDFAEPDPGQLFPDAPVFEDASVEEIKTEDREDGESEDGEDPFYGDAVGEVADDEIEDEDDCTI